MFKILLTIKFYRRTNKTVNGYDGNKNKGKMLKIKFFDVSGNYFISIIFIVYRQLP